MRVTLHEPWARDPPRTEGPEAHPKNTEVTPACLADDEVDISTIWGYALDGGQGLGPHDSRGSVLSKKPLQRGTAQVETWKRKAPAGV